MLAVCLSTELSIYLSVSGVITHTAIPGRQRLPAAAAASRFSATCPSRDARPPHPQPRRRQGERRPPIPRRPRHATLLIRGGLCRHLLPRLLSANHRRRVLRIRLRVRSLHLPLTGGSQGGDASEGLVLHPPARACSAHRGGVSAPQEDQRALRPNASPHPNANANPNSSFLACRPGVTKSLKSLNAGTLPDLGGFPPGEIEAHGLF